MKMTRRTVNFRIFELNLALVITITCNDACGILSSLASDQIAHGEHFLLIIISKTGDRVETSKVVGGLVQARPNWKCRIADSRQCRHKASLARAVFTH